MAISGKAYRWYYDTIACRYYDLMIKWCFLPFGGETKVRRAILDAASPEKGERILDMCCGTGSATFATAERVGEQSRIIGIDLSSGQIRVARRRNRFQNVEFMTADATNTLATSVQRHRRATERQPTGNVSRPQLKCV